MDIGEAGEQVVGGLFGGIEIAGLDHADHGVGRLGQFIVFLDCRLFPQDKGANACGRRRSVQPITAEPVAPPPARGIGPLLARIIDRQAASGLPPAYLPKDQGDDA
jgi:hypothetical protein